MTNDRFIKLCEKYAKDESITLHSDNKKAIYPLYSKFKKFCQEELRNEDDESSVYDWLISNKYDKDITTNNPKVNFIGHDPIDGFKILVSGILKDKINPKTEIKRGNEKELIKEISSIIKGIVGYDVFYHEGGSHIVFQDKIGKDLYVIEWHFDPNYEKDENLIKKVCKELNLTYKQLGEMIGYGDEAISKASRTGNISTAMSKALELYLENLKLKDRLKTLDTLSDIIKELSK
ncbi:hypothetical protein [Campylobacter corcagiensis]|uniref:hypothetical protein n=1 Tax=Campylobacter corcagiensis TaxID=1448857 RepID=UPI00046F40EE|nr:hypothetical protein [Campylobacter corcagiensis]QKF64514.1 hypothetical protein CCORG_0648 [Campylobacter corcagiensis]